MKKILKPEGFFWVLLLLVFSCEEETTGCLDTFAVNYSVGVDDACTGCCTYPVVRLAFNHKYSLDGELSNLIYGNTVKDGSGNPFRIQRIAFYVSDIALETATGTTLAVEDELVVQAEVSPGRLTERTLKDDILRVDARDIATLTAGTFRGEGDLVRASMQLGLPELTDNLLQTSLPEGHPLVVQNDTSNLNPDGTYVVLRIDYFPDTTQTARLESVVFSAPELSQVLGFPGTWVLPRGRQTLLVLTMDYAAWFREVDVRIQSPEAIREKIRNSLSAAFSLSQLVVQ